MSFVTALTFKEKAEDLFHLDLAYSPPFSTTKDPAMYTGMALQKAIDKKNKLITPKREKPFKLLIHVHQNNIMYQKWRLQ